MKFKTFWNKLLERAHIKKRKVQKIATFQDRSYSSECEPGSSVGGRTSKSLKTKGPGGHTEKPPPYSKVENTNLPAYNPCPHCATSSTGNDVRRCRYHRSNHDNFAAGAVIGAGVGLLTIGLLL